MRRGDTHALTFFVVSHEYFNEDEGSILAFFVAIFLRIIAFLSSAYNSFYRILQTAKKMYSSHDNGKYF